MQVIPAVDILDGTAVRLEQGNYYAITRYSNDPIAVVQEWTVEGAELVHVVEALAQPHLAGTDPVHHLLGCTSVICRG